MLSKLRYYLIPVLERVKMTNLRQIKVITNWPHQDDQTGIIHSLAFYINCVVLVVPIDPVHYQPARSTVNNTRNGGPSWSFRCLSPSPWRLGQAKMEVHPRLHLGLNTLALLLLSQATLSSLPLQVRGSGLRQRSGGKKAFPNFLSKPFMLSLSHKGHGDGRVGAGLYGGGGGQLGRQFGRAVGHCSQWTSRGTGHGCRWCHHQRVWATTAVVLISSDPSPKSDRLDRDVLLSKAKDHPISCYNQLLVQNLVNSGLSCYLIKIYF